MIMYSAAISACEKAKQPDKAMVPFVVWQLTPGARFVHIQRGHQRMREGKAA